MTASKDTREQLLKFYEKYYSANIMTLVVYGRGIPSFFIFFQSLSQFKFVL